MKIGLFVLWIAISITGCRHDLANQQKDEADLASRLPDQPPQSGWPNLFGPSHQSVIQDPQIRRDWNGVVPTKLWSIPVGTGYSSPVILNDKIIVVHRFQDLEIIECFAVEDGSSLWKFTFPAAYACQYEYSSGPYSTPVLFDGKLIAVGQAGLTHCLDLNDGSLIWSRDLFRDFGLEPGEWPVAASGIVSHDQFIFNLGAVKSNAGVVALDVRTGQTTWASSTRSAGHATPNRINVGGKEYLIVVTGDGLSSFDPLTGEEKWFFPFRRKKAETYNAVSPIVAEDRVLMVTGPGPGLLALQVNPDGSANEQWRDRRILDSQYTNLLSIGEFVFGFTPMRQGGPEMRCIDIKEKRLCWKWKAGLGRAMIVGSHNTIFILGEKGILAGIETSTAEPREVFRTASPILAGPCYSAPAIYQAKLFARNEKELVCYDLGMPSTSPDESEK